MPVFLAAAVLCLSPTVHDGDTIRCGSERVRIANIDAPELSDSPKCHDRRVPYAWAAIIVRARLRGRHWYSCCRGAA